MRSSAAKIWARKLTALFVASLVFLGGALGAGTPAGIGVFGFFNANSGGMPSMRLDSSAAPAEARGMIVSASALPGRVVSVTVRALEPGKATLVLASYGDGGALAALNAYPLDADGGQEQVIATGFEHAEGASVKAFLWDDRFVPLADCLDILPGGAPAPEGAAFYVAPDGDDSGPGTEAAPLASLAGARDKVRELKESSGLPDGGVTVYVRGGTYPVAETTFFDESDSGTEGSPVRYAAYPGETPIFTGGSYIDGSDFGAVTDEAALARLAPEARGEVLCYNLFENGFSYDELDYAKDFWQEGDLLEHVASEYSENDYFVPRMQVFIDDDALYPARYPNKADGIFAENPYNQYLMIDEVLETGFYPGTEELNGEKAVFKTNEQRIKTWESLDDIVIFGMPGWQFAYAEVVAEKIDPDNMTIALRHTPSSAVFERSRYAFANVFEELDAPGEYYIDKRTGALYLYPTKDMENAEVKISRFDESFIIDAKDASHLAFSGLTFELTRGSVFRIAGGENCSVEGCTLKNFGTSGVMLGAWALSTVNFADVYDAEDTEEFQSCLGERSTAENGIGHKIIGNTFLNTGHAAADIRTGHAGYREPGGAVFENNTVRHSGLIGSTYRSGLLLKGCGVTVKNNAFLFCRGHAIDGNIIDAEITYNEICDSPCDMAEDTGAIYLNYMCQNDGVQIRHNYIHDITNRGRTGIGFDYAFRSVAGYDNSHPFQDFSYNVVYNAPSVYNNPICNTAPGTTIGNVFIDCDYVLDYPAEFIRTQYNGETGKEIVETVYSLPAYYANGLYKAPLWRENYPEMYEYYEYMANEKQDMYPVMTEVRDNLTVYLEKRLSDRATELPETLPVDAKYGRVENNYFLYADPGFADARNHDFRLSEEAAAKYGVERLDMGKIGAPGGFAELDRLSDRYEDPLWGIRADKEIDVKVLGGRVYNMLSLWREVTPGVWEWAGDTYLNGEFFASFPVKPGGTYTAFYHGDADYPPQFMGGLAGTVDAPPPGGALTFTVDPDPGHWDYFEFELDVSPGGSAAPEGGAFYVAPDGDDADSGSESAPLATLSGAIGKIRELKESSGLPDGGVTVYFRGGSYPVEDTIRFDERDSGTEESPIRYAAYPGEEPVFTGGVYIGSSSLKPASGEFAGHIPAEARSGAYMVNLYENGFTREDLDYDNIEATGRTFAVFADDSPMHPARYPNKVPGQYAENPYNSYIYIEDGGAWTDGRHAGSTDHPAFQIPQELADRLAGWHSYDEVVLSGMMSWTWAHEKTYMRAFDPGARTITLNRNMMTESTDRLPNFGKYFIENVAEELDAPGEYYVDKQSGILYFYPPEGTDMDSVVLKIPKLRWSLVETRGASWLTFQSLTLELCRRIGFSIEGGSHVTVDGCTVENISGYSAIEVGNFVYEGWALAEYYAERGGFPEDEPSAEENGLYHTVKNCTIQNIGGAGASLFAGRVSTRESGHLLFENNVVLNTGLLDNSGGVGANGVGISLLRNTVKYVPGFGMGHNGPDGEVAYNLICDGISDPGQNDSSALGLHHGGISWGLKVHDNIIRDVQRTPVREWETWFPELTPNRLALYVDSYAPGAEITRNVVYNVPIGMSMPENQTFPSTYANNIFIDTMVPVMAYGLRHLEYYGSVTSEFILSEESGGRIEYIYNSGIYRTLWRDVCPEYYELYDYLLNKKADLTQPMSPVYDNICVNIRTPRAHVEPPESSAGPMPPEDQITPDPVYGRYENNRYIDYNPGFADYANGDVQLSKEAAELLGVEWIDLGKIGAKARN